MPRIGKVFYLNLRKFKGHRILEIFEEFGEFLSFKKLESRHNLKFLVIFWCFWSSVRVFDRVIIEN